MKIRISLQIVHCFFYFKLFLLVGDHKLRVRIIFTCLLIQSKSICSVCHSLCRQKFSHLKYVHAKMLGNLSAEVFKYMPKYFTSECISKHLSVIGQVYILCRRLCESNELMYVTGSKILLSTLTTQCNRY